MFSIVKESHLYSVCMWYFGSNKFISGILWCGVGGYFSNVEAIIKEQINF